MKRFTMALIACLMMITSQSAVAAKQVASVATKPEIKIWIITGLTREGFPILREQKGHLVGPFPALTDSKFNDRPPSQGMIPVSVRKRHWNAAAQEWEDQTHYGWAEAKVVSPPAPKPVPQTINVNVKVSNSYSSIIRQSTVVERRPHWPTYYGGRYPYSYYRHPYGYYWGYSPYERRVFYVR